MDLNCLMEFFINCFRKYLWCKNYYIPFTTSHSQLSPKVRSEDQRGRVNINIHETKFHGNFRLIIAKNLHYIIGLLTITWPLFPNFSTILVVSIDLFASPRRQHHGFRLCEQILKHGVTYLGRCWLFGTKFVSILITFDESYKYDTF